MIETAFQTLSNNYELGKSDDYDIIVAIVREIDRKRNDNEKSFEVEIEKPTGDQNSVSYKNSGKHHGHSKTKINEHL